MLIFAGVSWCKLAYWEERERVGAQYHCQSSSLEISSLAQARTSPGWDVLSLPALRSSNLRPSPATLRTRDKIGLGKSPLTSTQSESQTNLMSLQEFCSVGTRPECGFTTGRRSLSLSTLPPWMYPTPGHSVCSRYLRDTRCKSSTSNCPQSTRELGTQQPTRGRTTPTQ